MATKKILVVDDEAQIRNVLYQLLTKKGYSVTTAPSGKAALDALKKDRPDLIILDQNMPKMDGLETLKRIRESDKSIGIVMLTGYVSEELEKNALQLGVDEFLGKGHGTSAQLFLKSIENVLERKATAPKNATRPGGEIMVVDDEATIRDMLNQFLTRHGYTVKTASSGEETLEILKTKSYQPQLILLDINMPGIDGLVTLREIKKINKEAGVIIMTGINDEILGLQALESGAFEYIMKPFNLEYLELAILSKIWV